RRFGSPHAIEGGALLGKRVVNRAALAGLAMRAPFAGGLVDLRDVVDLAAQRAAPPFPSGNDARVGVLHDRAGRGHSRLCLSGAVTIAKEIRNGCRTAAAARSRYPARPEAAAHRFPQ